MQHLEATQTAIDHYLNRLRQSLKELPLEDRETIAAHAQARIELELEIDPRFDGTVEAAKEVLSRLGSPAVFGQRLQATVLPESQIQTPQEETRGGVCPACATMAPANATFCPKCATRLTVGGRRRVYGYEWKSPIRIGNLPLIHIATGRDEYGKLRVAKGVVAIGQFGVGLFTLAQFGAAGIAGVGQFIAAPLALSQFAVALAAIALFRLTPSSPTSWLAALVLLSAISAILLRRGLNHLSNVAPSQRSRSEIHVDP